MREGVSQTVINIINEYGHKYDKIYLIGYSLGGYYLSYSMRHFNKIIDKYTVTHRI